MFAKSTDDDVHKFDAILRYDQYITAPWLEQRTIAIQLAWLYPIVGGKHKTLVSFLHSCYTANKVEIPTSILVGYSNISLVI